MSKQCSICRTKISESKERCGQCADVVPTHILIDYPEQKCSVLFRASDGMGLAQQKDVVVVIGEDRNRNVSRVFVDVAAAARFTREIIPMLDLAKMDTKPKEGEEYWKQLGEAGTKFECVPIIETRDGGRGLYLPQNAMELPTQFKSFKQ